MFEEWVISERLSAETACFWGFHRGEALFEQLIQ